MPFVQIRIKIATAKDFQTVVNSNVYLGIFLHQHGLQQPVHSLAIGIIYNSYSMYLPKFRELLRFNTLEDKLLYLTANEILIS